LADEAPADEKTEAPTPRRREQAREKGDRLTSRELSTALGGIAGAVWLAAFAGPMAAGLREATATALRLDRQNLVDFRPVEAVAAFGGPIAGPLLALAALVLGAVALGQGLTGGVAFNPGLLAPRAGRLDPAKGLARMFGPKGLVELVKALAKALILVGLSAWLLRDSLDRLASLSRVPLEAALATACDLGLRLFLWLSLGLALIAGGDLPVQLRQWLQRLRMTKQELKDETKQSEGSPDVKQAIRRMARDSLKRASRNAMADATVVLTNPTHYAVALRYRPELDAAPVIVARGRGLVADVIRELAAERGIAVLAYPSVARALYFTGRVGMMIRADLYAAVATILAFVLRAGADIADAPPVEAPTSAWFDETGKQLVELRPG
jgi:flagellar biosynthetic protein FlhB